MNTTAVRGAETLVSLNECAGQLGLVPMSLWRWTQQYDIPTMRIGNVLAMRVSDVLVGQMQIYPVDNPSSPCSASACCTRCAC